MCEHLHIYMKPWRDRAFKNVCLCVCIYTHYALFSFSHLNNPTCTTWIRSCAWLNWILPVLKKKKASFADLQAGSPSAFSDTIKHRCSQHHPEPDNWSSSLRCRRMERAAVVLFGILLQRQRWWRVRRKRVCLGTGGCHIASARAVWRDMLKLSALFCFLSAPLLQFLLSIQDIRLIGFTYSLFRMIFLSSCHPPSLILTLFISHVFTFFTFKSEQFCSTINIYKVRGKSTMPECFPRCSRYQG